MSLLLFAKKKLSDMPYPLGWMAAQLPFGVRPGIANVYNTRQREITHVSRLSGRDRQRFVFSRVQPLAAWAYRRIPFYADLYLSAGIDPTRFQHFEELATLPVVTKKALQAVPLEHRSTILSSRALENTGGSSGQPLDFYIEPTSIPHEWAHMHHIWRRVGYKSRDLKIAFSGRSTIKDKLDYDSVRHHFAADIYSGWEAVAEKILALPFYARPKFLHGYPSAIFDFVEWLEDTGHPLLGSFRGRIRGLLLGSEYPSPEPRRRTEQILNCSSVSWYGHTERAVLAFEKDAKSVYHPFLSYGFVEAVPGAEGQRLLGTSYYNQVCPFIRYDTGDLVEADVSDGVVESFQVVRGRAGEFIRDRQGNKVFLTGLIFGRHHRIFDYCRHIQIGQNVVGTAIVYVVPKKDSPDDWGQMFDQDNVDLDFEFRQIRDPIRTASGKIPLLINNMAEVTQL